MVGVPLITPVFTFMLKPAGNAGLTEKLLALGLGAVIVHVPAVTCLVEVASNPVTLSTSVQFVPSFDKNTFQLLGSRSVASLAVDHE